MHLNPSSRVLFIPVLVLLFSFSSFAQEKAKDSGELLSEGVRLYDEGKYKDALALFLKVPEGDTNYATMVYETTLAYLADSSYDKAIAMARHGLALPDADYR